jgi:hypothetical protein
VGHRADGQIETNLDLAPHTRFPRAMDRHMMETEQSNDQNDQNAPLSDIMTGIAIPEFEFKGSSWRR